MVASVAPPYVTGWSSEQEFIIRPDPHFHGAPAIFAKHGTRGEGHPLWGKVSEERQRECVMRRRCQVCAGAVGTWGYLVAIPEEPLTRPSPLPLRLHEPLLCHHCLPATFRCPRIRQAYADGLLYVIEVERFEIVPTLLVRSGPAFLRHAVEFCGSKDSVVALGDSGQAKLDAAMDEARCFVAVYQLELLVTTGHVLPRWVLRYLAGGSR